MSSLVDRIFLDKVAYHQSDIQVVRKCPTNLTGLVGWVSVQLNTFSLPTWVNVKLVCDNIGQLFLSAAQSQCLICYGFILNT